MKQATLPVIEVEAMRLKILTDRTEDVWNWKLEDADFLIACKKHGIELVQNGQDITFIDTRLEPVDGPLIVFDRWDCSALTKATADKWDHLENVLGYITPIKAMAGSIVDRVFGETRTEKPVGNWCSMAYRYEPHQLAHWKEPWKKEIDVSFVGTTTYGDADGFCSKHRQRLMDNWSLLQGYNSVGTFVNRPKGQYVDGYPIARASKVIVSPWGMCEISWRDFEAVLSEAMIVKPYQSEFQVTVNPWQQGNVIYCNRDYSNLADAVDMALEQYDREFLETVKVATMRMATDIDHLAGWFCRQVKNIVVANATTAAT